MRGGMNEMPRLQETNIGQGSHRIPPGQAAWRDSQAQGGCRVPGMREGKINEHAVKVAESINASRFWTRMRRMCPRRQAVPARLALLQDNAVRHNPVWHCKNQGTAKGLREI
jgi:hypothetical protein